ncbi:RNA methyltransferase [Paracidobacterium acidisoli]|uniref:tRNA (cytidine/uridine-2'-O-)-methyltransferase TrmJ n=1 Tax=Paracidobacterium acidisoli TaxID=2303751 RepID=A0A372IR09_9BACT|nr:TrmJ/YjtD family RNA methyltransferase [Paracidobacterium acidisoli]MBT9330223.1 TrmJ/YjtD family RNA methyltransferase [Paracidobacterium acidisoli]
MTELNSLQVVLVRTRNPLNIGAAARAMNNFGFSRLRVVHPYEVSFREAQSAVGAADLLKEAEEFGSIADAVADCSLIVGTTAVGHREIVHPLLRLEQGGAEIRKRLTSGKVALLFGSEKHGLSKGDLSHCDWLMHIPMHAENSSMNLGQAVAVCLYEIVRDDNASARCEEPFEYAEAGDLERLTGMLAETLAESGYIKAGTETSSVEKIRRLVRRLQCNSEDARILTGMLAKIRSRISRAR